MHQSKPSQQAGGPCGWTGTIARVELDAGQCRTIPSVDMAENYVGGRGFAARLYWDMVQPETGALSPENPLMLMTGPLGGTPAVACSRLVISGKSPLHMPEQYDMFTEPVNVTLDRLRPCEAVRVQHLECLGVARDVDAVVTLRSVGLARQFQRDQAQPDVLGPYRRLEDRAPHLRHP